MESGIEKFLQRFTAKIYPSKEDFLSALKSKKRLTIYHGIDPTGPHLHLGHSTNLFLLKELQQLGHKIILLIGDFTAQIGDPTGKDTARLPLTREQVRKNARTYKQQVSKILDFKSKKNPAELIFNSKWLDRLGAKEIIKLTASFTHGKMIKRSMFQKRIKEGKEIYLHEFLYPLFQGYDSVALNVDGEVGGEDQTFNMLLGRDLLKIYRNKEKFVVTTPLLVNPKSGRKLMSKTESFIALDLPPADMYGKVMALPDEVVSDCFRLCTLCSEAGLHEIRNLNPRDKKARLAREITAIYYGKTIAEETEREFNKVFKEKELPSKIPLFSPKKKKYNIIDLLIEGGLVFSKSEAKRLILQKSVRIDGKVKENWKEVIDLKKGQVIKIGKRRFLKIR